ncbi:hypothetical protein ACFLSW_06450, partial [Candidatus Bipolaricaulota bacterium]
MEDLLRALHEALDGLEEDDLQIGDITKGDDGKKDSRGKAAKKAISKAMQHIAGLYKKLKLKASDIPRTDSEILEDAMKALLGMIGELLEEGHLRKANDMIDNLRRIVARCVKDEGKRS